jgi:transcriptional regulator with XRE-family HTH domain
MTIILYGIRMMGNCLRDILNREQVTAYRVCKDLDLDPAQMSRFLNGKGSISLRKFEKVAEYLGYDLQMVKRRPSRERSE